MFSFVYISASALPIKELRLIITFGLKQLDYYIWRYYIWFKVQRQMLLHSLLHLALYYIRGYHTAYLPSAKPYNLYPSSPVVFLAHQSHWLMVSYCYRWMSVVRRQQLLQTTSPPKLQAGF